METANKRGFWMGREKIPTPKGSKMRVVTRPKAMPPNIFPESIVLKARGAISRRSKDLSLLPRAMITVSMLEAPKKVVMAIRPGRNCIISRIPRIEKVKIITAGNINPMIKLGGLK